MPIEICTVGGYFEVGRNCTAVKVDDEVVIFDMGLHLENYIKLTEDEDVINISSKELMRHGAVPNIKAIDAWHDKVIAIVPTHAHLDHIGAIPYLAHFFKSKIICTPFAGAVIRSILKDDNINLKNEIQTMNPGSSMKLSKNLTLEFVNVTHSTPQSIIAVLHTPYGIVIYANDFKFDLHPLMGKRPDFERLQELGKKGILALICESTYASEAIKMPSELIAQEMLKDVLLGTDTKGKAVIVTTFSSHIARLKSIVECGKKMKRKVVFLGRSLYKYVTAAESIGLVNFSKEAKIVRFSSKVKKELKKINAEGKDKYLIVMTGHQGEPKSCLAKLARREYDFVLGAGDYIVFSCKVIPTPTNLQNREVLEREIRQYGARIFKDIHISGHAGREDLRDMINMTKPLHILPAHGDSQMKHSLAELAYNMGYSRKNVHLLNEGDRISL